MENIANMEKSRKKGRNCSDQGNKTHDLILNLTPENMTQHSGIE